jgi:S-adenosylmethionine:tRNA ribosyltransferase-isomerase
LETAATVDGFVKANSGWTDKFIYPPYNFKIADALITNFHVSGSTLFLLTCAFANRDTMMEAYHDAIKKKYRFHSYGDAMFIY